MSVKGSDSPALSALSSGCGSTELLSSGTHIETASSVPNKGGVLISGVVLYTLFLTGTMHGVLVDIFISGVSL